MDTRVAGKNKMSDTAIKIIMALCGLLTTIALALAAWSMGMNLTNQTAIADAIAERDLRDAAHESQAELIVYKLEQLTKNKDVDTEQNRRLDTQKTTDRKFWKLLHWSKNQINMARAADNKPLAEWPDLDVSE